MRGRCENPSDSEAEEDIDGLRECAPKPGDRLDLFGLTQIEAVHVDHPDAHMGLAIQLFGPELLAVQLVWTDMQGRWPWNKRFDFDGLRQPVLGMRARKAQKA